jgi:hypothetical protein
MGCIKILKPHLNGLHKNPEASFEWVAYQHIACNKVASKNHPVATQAKTTSCRQKPPAPVATLRQSSSACRSIVAKFKQLFKFASIFFV